MSDPGKYKNLWTRYLPVIRILLKKSLKTPQLLPMQKHEFESVGERDSSGYQFNLEFDNGRAVNNISGTAVARDLRDIMVSDHETKAILANTKFKIHLDKQFILNLKAI